MARRYLRPPGALPEIAFLAACTRCGDCVRACPVTAIVKAPPEAALAAGTPYIDPLLHACIACPDMPCAAACPTDALTVPPDGWHGYRLGALEFLPERCVTYRNVTCNACVEACPYDIVARWPSCPSTRAVITAGCPLTSANRTAVCNS